MFLTRVAWTGLVVLAVLGAAVARTPAPKKGAPGATPAAPPTPDPAPAPAPSRGPDVITLREITIKWDPVRFGHALHLGYAGVEGCATCHHHQEPGRVAHCTGCHSDRQQAIAAFHGLCRGCHDRVNTAQKLHAPMMCSGGGCHAPILLAVPGAQQLPVLFDHAKHRAIQAAGEGGCRACHHADPPDTAPRACAQCHPPGEELQAAFHKSCIGCHVERAGGRPGSPATKCSYCHGNG